MSIVKTFVETDSTNEFLNPTRTEENGAVDHIDITGLSAETSYYVRAGVTDDLGNITYSENIETFTTAAAGPDYFYIQNETNSTNTFSLHKYQNPATGTTIEYSFDKNNWVLCTYDSNNNCEITLNNQGDRVYFRSSDGFSERDSFTRNFVISLPVSVGGNMNTLLDYTDNNVSIYPICFSGAFINCAIINANNLSLPSLTLASNCYRRLFNGCTSLQSVPTNLLPATTLADSCYREMFSGCSSLTTAPNLPGINSANYCYYSLFYNCTSLIAPPQIDAVNMGFQSFYNMFNGCQSLEIGADLRSISSVGYQSARYMYSGCYLLNTVYAPNLSTWDSNAFTNWMSNAGRDVTGTKTFYAPTGVTIPTSDNSGIPNGWTRVDY